MADLEAPDPVEETPPAPVAEETPAAPVAPEDAEPEGTVDVGGQKYVPLGAVISERRKAQALKPKADQADQLAGYVNQVRPYIEFLQAHPNLLTQTQQQTAPTPVTTTQPSDEAAEALARTLDLYTADGQPDVKRAQKVREFIRGEASEQADARVKPLAESTTRERVHNNYQRALVTKAPDGRTVDLATLNAIWQRTNADILATEEGAAGVVAMALGLQVMQGIGAPAAAPPAPLTTPLHTEAPGSRTPNAARLNTFDEKIARMRGLTDAKYGELAKGFTAGRSNVLED